MIDLTSWAGEIAAFGTALCWTAGSQFFEAAGRRSGAMSVNLLRLILALLLFCMLSQWRHGTLFPLSFPLRAWWWLGLSGIIGFALGDMFLFKAFVDIGPRLSMLIMTLAAPMSAVIGMVFLGEKYQLLHWVGMAVTLGGVCLVILEKPRKTERNQLSGVSSNRRIRDVTPAGIMMAFLGALGQAAGYVLSKYGMSLENGYLDPFAATQIRVIAGTIGFLGIISLRRSWPAVRKAVTNGPAMGMTFGGAVLGPFLGVSLSLLALHYTTSGIAATITSMVPILIIPFSIFIGHEQVSLRAVWGAAVAVGGVITLTLS